MRILIVSDSHGKLDYLEKVISRVRPDRIIHCGDLLWDGPRILAMADCPLDAVKGNNDLGLDLPEDLVLPLGRHRVYVTHGHHEKVYWGREELAIVAAAHDCDYAIYGHTHVPSEEEIAGVRIYNPGSISQPRQAGRRPSFLVCHVDEAGELHFSQNYL